jgi:hypothetical protein
MSDYMCRYKKKRLNSIPGRHIAMSAWLYYSQADISASRPALKGPGWHIAAQAGIQVSGPEQQRPGQNRGDGPTFQLPSRHPLALGRHRCGPFGQNPCGPLAGFSCGPFGWLPCIPAHPASLLAGPWPGQPAHARYGAPARPAGLVLGDLVAPSAKLAQMPLCQLP